MIPWQGFAVIGPVIFAIYQSLSKLLPKDIPVFLVTSYAFFSGAMAMLFIHLLTSPNKSVIIGQKFLPLIIAIGTLIALGNFTIIKAYTLGASQSLFSAIYNPTYIIIGLLFGIFIWHEKLNTIQIAGIFLTIVGVIVTVYFKK